MKDVVFKILKAIKNNVRVAAFVLLVAFLLGMWLAWFKPKHYDGNIMMDSFYAQADNSIDVLVIGSSHTFVDVNTGTLWNEYGVPSFVIGGSLQPFWNSYYYLREAVKTQTPRLVILEALACNIDNEENDPTVIFNNVYGMHWNMDKLESIRASVSNTEGLVDIGLFFESFHNRYNELSLMDVSSDYGDTVRTENNKGFYDYFLDYFCARPEFDDDVVPIPFVNKEEYYYRLIIEYCQENNIPLLIMVSPDGGYNNVARAHYLYAEEIADEYGVDFVDFNNYYDEIGLDFANDFADIGHLNQFGNRKFTSYLGEYITENFDLVDRSNDTSGLYDSWEENYRYLEARFDNYLLQTTFDDAEYVERLSQLSDDYEVFVLVSDITWITDDVRAYLSRNGISSMRPFDSHRYMIRGGITTTFTVDDNGLYYEEFGGDHHLAFCDQGFYFDSNNIIYPDRDGVVFITYDRYNQRIVDSVTIDGSEVWRFDV